MIRNDRHLSISFPLSRKWNQKLTIMMMFLFTLSLGSLQAQHVGAPYGFAAVPGFGVSTTTGGAGGEVVIINGQQDAKKLQDALDDDDNPKIIYIYGSVQLPEYTDPTESPVSDLSDRMTRVRSNKTILGATADATIYGSGLSIYSGSGEGVDPQLTAVNNIIIQNLHFEGWYDDAINIQGGSHHVWIDHCTFSNGSDGAIDVKRASDLVTISYSHIYDHGKMSLVGHSTDVRDADMGHLRITYDHMWWDDSGTRSSRHPRIRHGIVHQTNSFFQGQSPDSAIDGIVCNEDGRLTVENCFFENPKWFTEVAYGDSNPGQVKERNNGFVGCKACDNGETVWNGKIDWNSSFSDLTGEYPDYPSADPADYYSYSLEDASTVKATVTSNSGAGVITIPDPGQGTTYYTLSTSIVGSGSVSPSGGTYADGSSVTLTATPASGYVFDSWSGDATGTDASVTVTMNSSKDVTATFTQDPNSGGGGTGGEEIHNFTESGLSSTFYSISGNLSDTKGTVTYEGMTLTQCLKIESSTVISFTAAQDGDLTLVFNEGWSGGFQIDGVSQNVSNGILTTTLAAGSHTLTKDDVANLYYMELAYAGGSGTTQYVVTTSSNGNGTVSGSGTYDAGSVISLTATPASGYQFDSWTGDASGTDNPLSVTVDGDKTITANFSAIPVTQYNLTTSVVGSGSVTPASGSFDENTPVTLTATPSTGYVFDSWSSDATGTDPSVTITMDANKNVTATFIPQQTSGGEEIHNFTESGLNSSFYSISGNLSDTKGTVTYEGMTLTQCLKIESSTSISFSSSGEGELTLVFNEGWSGGFEIDGVSQNVSNGILTTTLAAGSHTLTKDDVANLYYMTLSYSGGTGTTQYTVTTSTNGNGTVSGGGTYDGGSVISLAATSASGYQFDGWSGDASGTSNPLSVTVDANKSIIANFSATSTGECSFVPYQAEDGAWSNAAVETEHSGYLGAGYVNTENTLGTWAEITIGSATAGTFDAALRYASGSGQRDVEVFVNGSSAVSQVSLSGTGAWNSWSVATFSLPLNAGTNVVRFVALTSDGAPNLDQLEVCLDGTSSITYDLSVAINGQGSVDPSGGTYAQGESVSITAIPATGYQFDSWSGDVSGVDNPLTVTMNGNLNIAANFVEIPPAEIALAASGGDGQVVLNWTVSNTTLSTQEIFRDTDANISGSTSLGTLSTSQTSFTDNAVVNGTTYYYWVEGTTTSSDIVFSNAASATPDDGPSIDPSLIGFATLTGGTTGGSGGVSVTCSTGDCILQAISDKKDGIISDPLTIYVNGTITPSNTAATKIDVKDVRDISIIGVGTSGEFDGIGIKVTRAGNVIIQNITVHHVDIGDKDAISIEGPADHVWVDHCELYAEYQGTDKDYYDGLLDAKNDAEYITYSWNYLHDSWKMMLVGSSDGDEHDRKITIHHNWFENVNSRMPLYRFGTGHVFNNYYNGVVSTGINSRMGACLKVENNYFENANNPIVSAYSNELGAVDESGTIYVNVTWDLGGDTNEPLTCTSNLPYSYASVLHNTADVPSIVMQNAGVGKINSGARISDAVQQPIAISTDIYPNPASDMIKVRISDFRGDEVIRVINLSGVEMMNYQMTESHTELDISSLAGGAYILHISGGDQSVVKRFIKQ